MASYNKEMMMKHIVSFMKADIPIEGVLKHLVFKKEMSPSTSDEILKEENKEVQKIRLFHHVYHRMDSQATFNAFCEALFVTQQKELCCEMFSKYGSVFESIRKAFRCLKHVHRDVLYGGTAPVMTTELYRGDNPVSQITLAELTYLYAVKIEKFSFNKVSMMDGCPENLRERLNVYESEIHDVNDFIRSIAQGGLDVIVYLEPQLWKQIKDLTDVVQCITFINIQLTGIRLNLAMCVADIYTNSDITKFACVFHMVCFARGVYSMIIRKSVIGYPNCYLINRHAYYVKNNPVVCGEMEECMVSHAISFNQHNWYIEKLNQVIPRAW